MKTIPITIIAACSIFVTACNKKSAATALVETKIVYSHPNQADGGFEITRRQEPGTNTRKTPSSGQPLSLTDNRAVLFSQSTDASDPNRIRVTVESRMDGFPSETQVLEFGSGAPHPPAAKFANGLTAAVTVSTYTP